MSITEHSAAPAVAEDAQTNKAISVDLAYHEYCLRRQAGEVLDPERFCRQYPQIHGKLLQLLEAVLLVDENPHLVEALPPRPNTWPEVGQTVLGFTLRRQLGEGTFARVFLANEAALGQRLVVVKLSLLGAAEADLLGRLAHPNIVPIHSMKVDQNSGLTVICMPYLGSATLEHVQARLAPRPRRARAILQAIAATGKGPRAAADVSAPAVLRRGTYADGVVDLGRQLAEALAFVHAQGICHRDLKPSNVLFSAAGRPMLLDFNVSLEECGPSGRPGGTLAYSAPEQLQSLAAASSRGPVPVDAHSDVFALGVMLFELLAGEHPFGPIPTRSELPPPAVASLLAWLIARHQVPAASLRRANPHMDRVAARLIERCLAADPADRPAAAELASGLQRCLTSWRRGRRWVVRHSWAVLVCVCLLMTAGMAAVITWANRPPSGVRAWQQGQTAYQRGEYRSAVQHFNCSLEARPDWAEAMFARGRAYQHLGDLRLALADYEEAELTARDGRSAASMGYCLTILNRHMEAVVYYDRAIETGYAPAEVFNDRAFSHLQLGIAHRSQAKHDLDRAVRLDPQLQAAYLNRARLHFLEALRVRGHGLEEGIADIRVAIQLGPLTAELFQDAANLCAVAGWRDDCWQAPALTYMQQAVAYGCDPHRLMEDPPLMGLSKHSEFQRLLQRPAPSSPPQPAVRVVDPIQDAAN